MEWHKQIKADLAEAKSRIAELETEIERDTSLAQMAELEDLVVRVIKRAEQAERERDAARKRVAELEDVNLAARRRLESLEVSMGEKMPLGTHAALSCLREKGGA